MAIELLAAIQQWNQIEVPDIFLQRIFNYQLTFFVETYHTPIGSFVPSSSPSLVASSGNPTVFIPAAAAGLEGTVTRLHWLHQIPQGYLKASHMSLGPNMTGANPLPLQKNMGKWSTQCHKPMGMADSPHPSGAYGSHPSLEFPDV